MKSKNSNFYTFIAPLMILISIIGFTFRKEDKKVFYVPIGIVGAYLILEKEINRRIMRRNILDKINFFKKNK